MDFLTLATRAPIALITAMIPITIPARAATAPTPKAEKAEVSFPSPGTFFVKLCIFVPRAEIPFMLPILVCILLIDPPIL